jgi:hypothetical protein
LEEEETSTIRSSEEFVRYRTAAILSGAFVVLIGGMFAYSAVVWAIFLPSLKQGLPNPIPGYEQILLEIAVLCGNWKWILAVLAPPTVATLFALAGLTGGRTRVKR